MQVSVRMSYLEIYNEEIRDLLHPDVPSKSIVVRESAEGQVLVVGAQEENVCALPCSTVCSACAVTARRRR